jgi:hypothetical protein
MVSNLHANVGCCRAEAKEWIAEGTVESLANLQRSEQDNQQYDTFVQKARWDQSMWYVGSPI